MGPDEFQDKQAAAGLNATRAASPMEELLTAQTGYIESLLNNIGKLENKLAPVLLGGEEDGNAKDGNDRPILSRYEHSIMNHNEMIMLCIRKIRVLTDQLRV